MDEDLRRLFREPVSPPRYPDRRTSPLRRATEFLRQKRRTLAAAAAVVTVVSLVAMSAVDSGTDSRPPRTGQSPTAQDQGSGPGESDLGDAWRPEPGPTLEDLGGGRFRGPRGVVVKAPKGWRVEPGRRRELWATLIPVESKGPLPRIGVGEIDAQGLDGPTAMQTVKHYLAEVLPELSSTEEPYRGGLLMRGKGSVDGTQIEDVRWLRSLPDSVLVVWGLFPAGHPHKVELVVDSVDVPSGE